MSSFFILSVMCLFSGVHHVAATAKSRPTGFGQLFSGIHDPSYLRSRASRNSPRNEVVSGLSTTEAAAPGWVTQYISTTTSDCTQISQTTSYVTNTCLTYMNKYGNTTDTDGVPYGSQYQYCAGGRAYIELYDDSDCTVPGDYKSANSSAPTGVCTARNADTDEAYGYFQVAAGSFTIECTDDLPTAGSGLFSNSFSTVGLFEDESCSFSTEAISHSIVNNYCTVTYDDDGTTNDESFLIINGDEYYYQGTTTCNPANLSRIFTNQLDTCTQSFVQNVTYNVDDAYYNDDCSNCGSPYSYAYYTSTNPVVLSAKPSQQPTSHSPTAAPSHSPISSTAPSSTASPSVVPTHLPSYSPSSAPAEPSLNPTPYPTSRFPTSHPSHAQTSTNAPSINRTPSAIPTATPTATPSTLPPSNTPSASPTITMQPSASPSASQNYYFNAEQILDGIDYDTYMANYGNNNFVVQSSIAYGLSLPTLTTPSTTIEYPPGNIVIFSIVATSSASSSSAVKTASSGGSVAVQYAVNFNAAAMPGYTPQTAYDALVSALSSYSVSSSATGFTSILQATAANYGTTVDLTSVSCYTAAYTPILYSGSTTSTGPSSSSSDTGKINGLIAGLVIFAVLFVAAVGVAIFFYQSRGTTSNSNAVAEPAVIVDNPMKSATNAKATHKVGDEQL